MCVGEVEMKVQFAEGVRGQQALPLVVVQHIPFLGAVVGDNFFFYALLGVPLLGCGIEVEFFDGLFGVDGEVEEWRVVGEACPRCARDIVVFDERP